MSSLSPTPREQSADSEDCIVVSLPNSSPHSSILSLESFPSDSPLSFGLSDISEELHPEVVDSGMTAKVEISEATLEVKRHGRFFFEDGNFTFTVEGVLYRVHRYYFVRDSAFFASQLLLGSAGDLDSVDAIDEIWGDVSAADLDLFLSVLYPLDFDKPSVLSVEDWSAVLRLATKWGFASVRRLAVRHLDVMAPPLDKLTLGRGCAVEEWVVPALTALCIRPKSLGLHEARRMVLEDIIVVTSVREAVRTLTWNVGERDILRRVGVLIQDRSGCYKGGGRALTANVNSTKDKNLSSMTA
ncbi:hypothetical protein BV25DRAFT_947958 [Artomyces pyxidatus]|uniref:Uncharacterized protein n=1 Tax=Artomyces pyxidatus TaxID=48021 RepID=A0ACB8SWV0_9AGAM|nr:hypothetical protein BV25DRAFT_947958 [Artomyces pyxidatus]